MNAPSSADERGLFEKWASANRFDVGHKSAKGEYIGMATAPAWEAWQARASLGAAQVPSLSKVPADVTACLGFFASVIKSGEPWTDTCQRMYDAAKAAALSQPSQQEQGS